MVSSLHGDSLRSSGGNIKVFLLFIREVRMLLKILCSILQVPTHPLGLSDNWLLPRKYISLMLLLEPLLGKKEKEVTYMVTWELALHISAWGRPLAVHAYPTRSQGEAVSSKIVQQYCDGRIAGDISRSAEEWRVSKPRSLGAPGYSCVVGDIKWVPASYTGASIPRAAFTFLNACLTVELVF